MASSRPTGSKSPLLSWTRSAVPLRLRITDNAHDSRGVWRKEAHEDLVLAVTREGARTPRRTDLK
jgi:hypothetical protein